MSLLTETGYKKPSCR